MLARVQTILDREVRPRLQSHGGDVAIVDLVERRDRFDVSFQLQGACRRCELRTVTFAATIHGNISKIAEIGKISCDRISMTPVQLDRIGKFFGEHSAAS